MTNEKNIYPDWFNINTGGIWAITQRNNLFILQPGYCPRVYDEFNKKWLTCQGIPALKQTDNITIH